MGEREEEEVMVGEEEGVMVGEGERVMMGEVEKEEDMMADVVEVVQFVTQGYHFFRTLCSGSILMVRGRHFCLVICFLSPCIVHAVVRVNNVPVNNVPPWTLFTI